MKNDMTVKELRKFSFIMAILIAIIFGVISPYLRYNRLSLWGLGVALIFVLWPFLSIKTLALFYNLWMKVGHVLGWINTRVILGATFYLLFTPMGLVMRLFGYNPLKLGYDKNSDSYRELSESVKKERMEVPF